MELEVFGQTDVGLKREINQDSILLDSNIKLFVVADGMGGHRGGEVASAIAVETAQEIGEHDSGKNPKETIRKIFQEASRRIYQKSIHENPELMGMGTTMVLALASGNRIYFGNVGDSRAYLIKDKNLWQLTEDHSLVNVQIKEGLIRPEEAHDVAGKNVITRSVGYEEVVEVDLLEREVSSGEIYLLCSDGLCGLVQDSRIQELCISQDPQSIVERCVAEAKKAGGDDNISVLVIKIV